MVNGKRIYLAGKYSGTSFLEIMNNIHNGIRQSVKVLKDGNVPFCPWLDHQFFVFAGEGITVSDIYRYSMGWLEVSDEVWVLPDSENSRGTQGEIERARELGIPVKYLDNDGNIIGKEGDNGGGGK